MFNFFKEKNDPESLEVVRKLDQDLFEQLLFEFKDEDFYFNHRSPINLAQIDMSDPQPVKRLIKIEEIDAVLIHAEDMANMFLINEYQPSKKTLTLINNLRKISLKSQIALYALLNKKNRKQVIRGSLDFEVSLMLTHFKSAIFLIFHEIFETYDIRVYPTFRTKTKEYVLAYRHNQP